MDSGTDKRRKRGKRQDRTRQSTLTAGASRLSERRRCSGFIGVDTPASYKAECNAPPLPGLQTRSHQSLLTSH